MQDCYICYSNVFMSSAVNHNCL